MLGAKEDGKIKMSLNTALMKMKRDREMGYEIDFLQVGEGSKGGDAIALRWGNLTEIGTEQTVMVIDGGTKDSGQELVDHIKKYYKTDEVDYVINTHPDADHSSGLTVVLENLNVKNLIMHKPWDKADELTNFFKSGKVTIAGLRKNIIASLNNAYDLEMLAKKRGIEVSELFSDHFNNPDDEIIILSPSEDYYKLLVANFRETPEPKEESALEMVYSKFNESIKYIFEQFGFETLQNPAENETSPENNSSIILLLQILGEKFLFTGDAGSGAIFAAIEKAETLGIDLQTINFLQVPHHGSKHNIGPQILDKLIGPKLSDFQYKKTAYISVPPDGDPKHPSRKVINALIRRGSKVFTTKDGKKYHYNNASVRNWQDAKPISFFESVEE
jgi:beta-lactamase superfamily II metal-dependent hydrolase